MIDPFTESSLRLNARYVPERLLGDQPSGRFLVAVDTQAGGRVTVLVPRLQGTSPGRFLKNVDDELQRLAPLADTPYCTLRDAGLTDEGEPFLVVHRPTGSSLGAQLRAEGRLSADRALSIAIQLCDLVRRAHALEVYPVPLDLDSIIVDTQAVGKQRVSVVDLGLNRGVYGDSVLIPARPPGFDSPQAYGRSEPDPRDDVFALTAVLHAMILGVTAPPMSTHGPADGSGWAALPDDGRGLDRRLEACLHTVLLKGLAPERDERFPHIGALQRAFSGLRQLMSLSAPAFELLAATRGRLGQAPDALDLRAARPALDKAAEARARVRQVMVHGYDGAANLSSLTEKPEQVTEPVPALGTDSSDRTGDFRPAPGRAAAGEGPTMVPLRPFPRLAVVRRTAET